MQPVIISAVSVSDALAKGLHLLNNPGVEREESRNGGVSVWNGPVITQSVYPLRRVLFSPARNANPFFHLFESMWMLAGREDLPIVAQFNQQMALYSDDGGKTQPAAYGYRWIEHFGFDQLESLTAELKNNPGTRRAVLTMWDGGRGDGRKNSDLGAAIAGSADVPCNTQCYFTLRDGKLYMAVTCRSNDVLWGAHGANAVHFSILLEYMAAMVGVEVGEMTQFSWNYHLYDGILKYPVQSVIEDLNDTDYYMHDGNGEMVEPTPIFNSDTMEAFHDELPALLHWCKPLVNVTAHRRGRPPALEHPFLKGTCIPMMECWDAFKRADLRLAVSISHEIKGDDWRTACKEWMTRRYNALHVSRGGDV